MATALPGIFNFTQAPSIPTTQLDVGSFSDAELTPEVRALVEKSFAGPRGKATTNLRGVAESVAARRGLELFDTPVGEPFLRAQSELESDFGSRQATSELGLLDKLRNFKQGQAVSRDQSQFSRLGLGETGLLNRSKLFETGREFDENLRFSSEQFQELLSQQSIANELRLTDIAKDLSIGLSRSGGTSVNVSSGSTSSLLDTGLGLLTTGLSKLKP